MSLLGEDLAEEWLNRQGFFTIRGAKVGTGEIDLLAVRPSAKIVDCWHFEVQASLRPVSYICPAPKKLRQAGKSAHNAKKRALEEVQLGVQEWVEKKFTDSAKADLRTRLWPGEWKFGFIVGNVKFPEELSIIARSGIKIVRIAEIIKQLSPKWTIRSEKFKIGAACGADLVDLVFAHQQLVEDASIAPSAASRRESREP